MRKLEDIKINIIPEFGENAESSIIFQLKDYESTRLKDSTKYLIVRLIVATPKSGVRDIKVTEVKMKLILLVSDIIAFKSKKSCDEFIEEMDTEMYLIFEVKDGKIVL